MSDFADDLNEWVARQAQSSVEDQVLAVYAENNPAPDGQEWFIACSIRTRPWTGL